MTGALTVRTYGRWHRLLAWAAGGLLALGIVKYVALLAQYDFDFSKAPNGVLALLLVPAVGIAFLPRRAAVVVLGVFSFLVLALLVFAIVTKGFAQEGWQDTFVVFAGTPVALLGVVAAYFALTGRR